MLEVSFVYIHIHVRMLLPHWTCSFTGQLLTMSQELFGENTWTQSRSRTSYPIFLNIVSVQNCLILYTYGDYYRKQKLPDEDMASEVRGHSVSCPGDTLLVGGQPLLIRYNSVPRTSTM